MTDLGREDWTDEVDAASVDDYAEPVRQLVEGGVVLTIATFAASASNYLFQVLAGRILGPSQYGLLSSLFTLVALITISASSLQAACAKVAATETVIGEHRPTIARLNGLLQDPLVRGVGLLCLAGTVVVVAASPLLASFLDTGVLEIVAFGLLLPSVGLVAIAFGRLQGLERFLAYAALGFGLAFAKLSLGIGALAVGLGAGGGLFALVATTTVGAGFGLWWSRDAGPTMVSTIRPDVLRALLAIGLFTAMISLDIPIARHFLGPAAAGQFAAAAVIGHGVIWLPQVVALVAFPEMVKARATAHDERRLLLQSAAIAFAMCLVGVVLLFVAGGVLFETFYGSKYTGAPTVAWKLGLATVPFAIANLFMFHHLAGRGSRFIALIAVCALAELVAFAFFHSSSNAFVLIVGGTGTLLALLLAPWRRPA